MLEIIKGNQDYNKMMYTVAKVIFLIGFVTTIVSLLYVGIIQTLPLVFLLILVFFVINNITNTRNNLIKIYDDRLEINNNNYYYDILRQQIIAINIVAGNIKVDKTVDKRYTKDLQNILIETADFNILLKSNEYIDLVEKFQNQELI